MDSAPVRVRFAPSPTGYLHVGGARTALFNWLYARRHGGAFVLRIEDTDLQRSSDEMTRAILDGLAWLGLTWDEGPFLQSAGRARHEADASRIEGLGAAYRCFCEPAALDAKRKAAEAQGTVFRYDRTCLGLDEAERRRRADAGEPWCLRLLVPPGRTAWEDLVHGGISFDNGEIEDLVLLRSDGSPTYNLSCVSDDVVMRITHVIRGDDHVSNTPKQILIYRALGAEPPRFGHLPLILGADRKRLSKRHGAVAVTEYRNLGFLPEALFNFLALLGWSPGGDREVMAKEEMIALFSFDGVNPRSAVFDTDKLEWMNAQYLTRTPAADLLGEVRVGLEGAGLWSADLEGSRRPWLIALVDALKSRAKRIADVVRDATPFLTEAFDYDADAARKHLAGSEVGGRLEALAVALGSVAPFDAAGCEAALRALADRSGVPAAKLIHPARVALTGRAASPGIFDVMVLVGKEAAISRLRRAAAFAAAGPRS